MFRKSTYRFQCGWRKLHCFENAVVCGMVKTETFENARSVLVVEAWAQLKTHIKNEIV